MYSEGNQRYNKQYSELCSQSLCKHKIKEIACNWLDAVNGGRPVWKLMRIYTVYGTILLDLSELNSPGSWQQCMRMYTTVLVNCLAYSLMV